MRAVARTVGEAVVILMTFLVVVAGVSVFAARAGHAAPVPYEAMSEGGLFLPSDQPGYVLPATTVDSDVSIDVNGLIARTRIRQTFVNPTDSWMEGVYVFPLPENAAVDRLRMIIGDRVVEGRIEERQRAEELYEEAAANGQQASLVSQERPNVFTNSVANIPPDAGITVEIEYQQALTFENDRVSLRFPMVVLPRYTPGEPLPVAPAGTGWAADTAEVPDASRVTPPVADPAVGPINPVALTVTLNPGFAIGEITSDFHDVHIDRPAPDHAVVSLADGQVPADRDFELVWTAAPSETPQASVFSERIDDFDYHLVMVMPPQSLPEDYDTPPREVVFIFDKSGSMAGESIEQARSALMFALARLRPQDRFNIIAFDNEAEALFPTAQAASDPALRAGRNFVASLAADGGTEMFRALELALDGRTGLDRMRQIVFITDGAVSNEEALFGMIHDRLGDSRLFTVGIGSAPNSHFMREAAEAGRGTFTHVGSTDQVRSRMAELFQRLEHPALTDIVLDWPDPNHTDMFPERVADLYLGEPVMVSARMPAADEGSEPQMVRLSGHRGDAEWSTEITLPADGHEAGVATVWARADIQELERRRWRNDVDADLIADQILEVALQHQLVSQYTSLVAIDDQVVRPDGEPLAGEAVATNMPDGVDMQMGPTLADAMDNLDPRVESLRAIRNMARTGIPSPVALPVGGTSAPVNLAVGLSLMALAFALLVLAARQARIRQHRR